MTAATATFPADGPTTQEAVDRNAELFQGYILAQMEDPVQMETVPAGATLILLPRGDADGIEAALALARDVARQGHNVYLRHVDRRGRPI